MAVEVLVGCARAKAAHADEGSIRTDDLVPALPDGGFHGHLDPRGPNDVAPLRKGQPLEQLETRHRYHAGMNAVLTQELAGFHGKRDLGAAGEQGNLRIT